MAYSVFDSRRGTWSIRWHNGFRYQSETIVRRPPKGWKPGDPRPKEPPVVLEARAARDREEERNKASMGDPVAGITVRAFLDVRVADRTYHCSPRTIGVIEAAFDQFAAWCEDRGVTRFDGVNSTVCNAWFAARSRETSQKTGRPIARGSMKRDRALLSAAWNQAVKLGTIARNPWVAVEIPSDAAHKRRGSWTPEELDAIISVARPWLRNALVVGCHTGLRIRALVGLEWRDVHFSQPGEPGLGTVTVRKEMDKGGKGYVVPMSERCYETLRRMHGARPPGESFVILGHKRKRLVESDTTAEAIQRVCRIAGLPKPDSPNHHMRRTFGRWAALGQLTGRHVPIYVVSKWMGHASVAMTESYLDLPASVSHEWMVGNQTDRDFQADAGHLPDST